MGFALLLLFLGWFFGLFSSPIANLMERRRQRASIASGILTELAEVRRRLALVAWGTWNRHGLLTIDRLLWAADALEGTSVPEYQRMIVNMRGIAANGEGELALLNAQKLLEQQASDLFQDLRQVQAPFLTLHLHQLDLFDESVRTQLWWCDAQLRLYAELISEGRDYFRLTFDQSVTGANRDRVVQNLERTALRVAQRAEIIANYIHTIPIA